MLPHPAAPNAADVVQFCPNKSVAGVICNKPVDPQQHHCYGCRYGGSVDRRHAAVGRCIADVIQSQTGVKETTNKRYLLSLVLSTDGLNTLGWILSLTSTVQSRIGMCPLLLPSLAIRPWSQQPAQNQGLLPKERKRTNSTDIHTSISFLSSSRPQVGLAHMQGNSSTGVAVTGLRAQVSRKQRRCP